MTKQQTLDSYLTITVSGDLSDPRRLACDAYAATLRAHRAMRAAEGITGLDMSKATEATSRAVVEAEIVCAGRLGRGKVAGEILADVKRLALA